MRIWPRPMLPGAATPMARKQRGLPSIVCSSAASQAVQLVLHNQDNREHDLLDSDDYYQFEGGVAATVRHLSGDQPTIYHNDHSRPDSPRIRTLKEEIGRVVRGRAANPKWLKGVMRHGYKGAFEIAATVDYLFAFAATSRVVEDHHFDALFDAYLVNDQVRDFIEAQNPDALDEILRRFHEAIERGLWRPRANDVYQRLESLTRSSESPLRSASIERSLRPSERSGGAA